ncbi:MAG: LysM peptidoglycan-binding domain-containing protein [Caldilineales bacterium]|nr:LysM peptidoglycan-binding domain-containing protein [Caldilineales bacterium]
MTIRECPNCGAQISHQAEQCFMCGAELAKPKKRRGRPSIADIALVTGILLIMLLWWRWDNNQRVLALTPTATATPTATGTPAPTATPSPTATDTPTITPTATPIFYTVVSGDTYLGIAGQFNITLQELLAANNLTGNEILRVSQVLFVPSPQFEAPDQPRATPTPPSGIFNYTVQTGDTLGGIAIRFQVDIASIINANSLAEPDTLIPGTVLLIPMGSEEAAAPDETPISDVFFDRPVLVSPHPNSEFVAEPAPLLRWVAVGLLPEDAWYRVRVAYADPELAEPEPFLVKTTSLRLDPALRPPEDASSQRLFWWVQVVSLPEQGGAFPLSPVSEVWDLEWR